MVLLTFNLFSLQIYYIKFLISNIFSVKMKISVIICVMVYFTHIDGLRKTTPSCVTNCTRPTCATLPSVCPNGMVVVSDPCGCECPKCACTKICNYRLDLLCQNCIGGTTTYDQCGCRCPLCVC